MNNSTNLPETRQTIEDICALRDTGLDLYKKALYYFGQSKQAFESIHGVSHAFDAPERYDYYSVETEKKQNAMLDDARKHADAALWNKVLELSGLINLMSASDVSNFRRETSENPPELTVETIRATVAQWAVSGEDVFQRGLIEVFAQLDSKYCVNSAFKIGTRAILQHAVQPKWSGEGWAWYSSSHRESGSYVRDIERVFYVLDKKKMPENHLYGVWEGVGVDGKTATDYMTLKAHLNGNLHITFTRPDLVDQANRLIAKHFGLVIPQEGKTAKRRAV